jgi:hypothetical protein
MKKPAGILLIFLPVAAIAQNYPGMHEGDTRNMMLQMQEMQDCMQRVDQSRLQAFEQRASKVEAEVKSLCAGGKRDAAQQQAVTFSQEMAGDTEIQKVVECTKIMSGIMPMMPFLDRASEPGKSARHVCDQ